MFTKNRSAGRRLIAAATQSVCDVLRGLKQRPAQAGRSGNFISERLERRMLLSSSLSASDIIHDWTHLSPVFAADLGRVEQTDPAFAQELSADLARYGLSPEIIQQQAGFAVAAEMGVLSGPPHGSSARPLHPRHHRPTPIHHLKPHVLRLHLTRPHLPHKPRRPHHVFAADLPANSVTVLSSAFNYNASLPQKLSFQFSADVSASLLANPNAAISVIDLSTAAAITPSTFGYDPTGNTATWGLGTSWLPDSSYAVVLHSSLIHDAFADYLQGSDGIAGHDWLATAPATTDNGVFWFMDSDFDRSRTTDFSDLTILSRHYGQSGVGWSNGDANYDGIANFNDLVIVSRAYGKGVPMLPQPQQVLPASVSGTSVKLSWNAPSGVSVSAYDIYRDSQPIATGVTDSTFTDTGLSPNTTHMYLIVSKDANNDSSFAVPLSVTTATSGSAPIVAPIGPQSIVEGQVLSVATTFTDPDTGDTHTANMAWGDGSSTSATVTESGGSGSLSASHTYTADAATYNAVLTVRDENGGLASVGFPVTVAAVAPVLSVTGPSSVAAGQPFALNFSAQYPSNDPDGDSISQWMVNFDDGAGVQTYPSTTSSVTHAFPRGTLGADVQVAATDDDATYLADPFEIVVNSPAPTITTSASVSPNPVTGTTAQLSVGASDQAGGELTYDWTTPSRPTGVDPPTFSDNNTDTASTVTATFSAAGSYTLLVTATNPEGVTARSSVNVTVQQRPKTIAVSPDYAVVAPGDNQQFEATALDQFADPLDSQPGFSWSVTAGPGIIDQTGLFTAPSQNGPPTTVQATGDGISGTATVVMPTGWFTHGEASVSNNTVTMGVAGRLETDSQAAGVPGASILVPPQSQYTISFNYNLSSWDSYNQNQGDGHTGYFDSFSVSVTSKPYWELSLTDPLSGSQFPFVWGGTSYNTQVLWSTSGSRTVTIPEANPNGPNYLNVVLDTITPPDTDGAYPSWGTITVTQPPAPPKVTITAHRTGLNAGQAVSDSVKAGNDPTQYLVLADDDIQVDTADGIPDNQLSTAAITNDDYQRNSSGNPIDPDLAKLTLSALPSGVNSGEVDILLSDPSAVRLFKQDGTLLWQQGTTDPSVLKLNVASPSGYLSGLTSGSLDVWL